MSYESLAAELFQSEARSAVLGLTVRDGVSGSVSELARRAGLSTRAVAVEVAHLARLGLLEVSAHGGANQVRANPAHPALLALRTLLDTAPVLAHDEATAERTRASLSFWGAPLAAEKPQRHFGLVETLLRGVELAKSDGTVLRVLPSLIAARAAEVDWVELKEGARRRKLKAELGAVVEVTSVLTRRPELSARVADLRDLRQRLPRFLPAARTSYERRLAEARSPDAARSWNVLMNVSEESFRSTLEKHGA